MAVPKDGQQFVNAIGQEIRAFGYITGAWKPFIDVQDNALLTNWEIRNTLDEPVTIMLPNTLEIILAATESWTKDGFVHGAHLGSGAFYIRHNGAAPSAGEIKTTHW